MSDPFLGIRSRTYKRIKKFEFDLLSAQQKNISGTNGVNEEQVLKKVPFFSQNPTNALNGVKRQLTIIIKKLSEDYMVFRIKKWYFINACGKRLTGWYSKKQKKVALFRYSS